MDPKHHAPIRHNTKIFMSGRTGKMLWDDGTTGNYFVIFANDYYLRVKDTSNGVEFVTVREAMSRFYPEDIV